MARGTLTLPLTHTHNWRGVHATWMSGIPAALEVQDMHVAGGGNLVGGDIVSDCWTTLVHLPTPLWVWS